MKKIIAIVFLIFLSSASVFASKIDYKNPDAGVYVFKIDTKKYGSKIKPYMTEVLTTPQRLLEENNNLELVVNGGYFDANNAKSVSYVVIDNKKESDIEDYQELSEKLKEQGRLDKVISRGELRILEKDGSLKFDIARHNKPIPSGYNLKHCLQAGPIVYPSLDLVGEGFVVYDGDDIKLQTVDILKKRERTLIGLKGKWLYIVIFTKDHTMDAKELNEYAKEMGFKKALGLDGGLSTSVSGEAVTIGSLGKYQRRVKSFLVIER